MDLQSWLIVVGVIIILGILLDGLRRMHLAKKDSLKMSRDLGGQIEKSPLDEDFNPELPGGGVRVLSAGVDTGMHEFDDMPSMSADASEREIPADAESLNPSISEPKKPTPEPQSVSDETPHATVEKDPSVESSAANVEHEVIVINVDAQSGQVFSGAAINQLLIACGMKHGEMSIYHRHEEGDLLSPIQFSVANAVEPGYFEPSEIESLTTPGVSFFMSVPGPKEYLKAFDYMYETAKCFAENLQGDLKDENRSVLTAQTIEHYKQRIRDFERKQLCKARP